MRLSHQLRQRVNIRGNYRNPNGTYTAAAIRARAPYAPKNAFLGISLLSFCVGCYLWAYKSFTPDDFSDVPIPPVSEEELVRLKQQKR